MTTIKIRQTTGRRQYAGPAIPVKLITDPARIWAAAALPVVVVSAEYIAANGVYSGPALEVYQEPAGHVYAGPAWPVYLQET